MMQFENFSHQRCRKDAGILEQNRQQKYISHAHNFKSVERSYRAAVVYSRSATFVSEKHKGLSTKNFNIFVAHSAAYDILLSHRRVSSLKFRSSYRRMFGRT